MTEPRALVNRNRKISRPSRTRCGGPDRAAGIAGTTVVAQLAGFRARLLMGRADLHVRGNATPRYGCRSVPTTLQEASVLFDGVESVPAFDGWPRRS